MRIKSNIKTSIQYCIRHTGMVLLSVLVITSCMDDIHTEDRPKKNSRTILFYMGGDNNLSAETDQKLEQLRLGWSDFDGHLVVYVDNRGTVPKLMEICRENSINVVKTLREYPQSSSADASVFNSVIQEVCTLYPSSSYGLIVFSHASGWMPEHTYEKPVLRSIIIDQKAEMELCDFAAAIPDHQFDFIVFEACFMAGIEVAYELRDKTDFLFASSAEIISPGFTNIYARALPFLFEHRANLKGFASATYSYFDQQQGEYHSFTGSIIETGQLRPLAEFLRNNINHNHTPDIAGIQPFDRRNGGLFFDFADYYSRLVTESKQAELEQLIANCVSWKAATETFMPTYGGFEIQSHSGLTTYIPQDRYPNLNEAYKQLNWYKNVLKNE